MKKIVSITLLSICSLFAFDVGGAMKNVGTSALNGNTDKSSLAKTAGESLGLTPEALGTQLANSVKSNNTTVTSVDKAKELCTQASTVQSFANISSDIVTKAIAICGEKVLSTK